jgi:uncharacterized protein (TIGR00369 family)
MRVQAGVLAERMGIRIVEAGPDRVVATMPVEGNTQPHGILHGGASCVLAETVGSIAAGLYAGTERIALGIEINATHHRSAAEGLLTGIATPVHQGRTLATYQIDITDSAERLICSSRLTCLLRDARADR